MSIIKKLEKEEENLIIEINLLELELIIAKEALVSVQEVLNELR